MSTTQAFRTALHIPISNPSIGEMVSALSAGELYITDWAAGGGTGAFPDPTGPNQFLVTSSGFPYVWTIIDGIDAGTF